MKDVLEVAEDLNSLAVAARFQFESLAGVNPGLKEPLGLLQDTLQTFKHLLIKLPASHSISGECYEC